MREFVFNEASLATHYACDADAVVALDGIVRGIARLVSAGVANKSLRASRPLHEIAVAPGLDLFHLAQIALSNPLTKSSAILFLKISHRIPIDDGLDPDMLTHLRLADLITPVTSGATALVLCALSDWIALGFPTEPRWDVDLLALSVVLLNEECDEIVKPYEVDHLAREAHAEAIAERHRTNRIAVQTPEELWQNRMSLFPHLSFGLDVEDHLCRLGESVFREAAESFRELNRTAAAWQRTRTVRPPYASKVTPESAVTMQQYGNRRVFRDMNGEEAIYEFHARLQGGFRVHIRELPSERRIEIGYVGPHLPTKKY